MTTTTHPLDESYERIDVLRLVRAVCADPFADRNDVAQVIDRALAEVVRNLDDLHDDLEHYQHGAVAEGIDRLTAIANRASALRAEWRDVMVRHGATCFGSKARVVDFRWGRLDNRNPGDVVFHDRSASWSEVVELRPLIGDDDLELVLADGQRIRGRDGDLVKVAAGLVGA